MEQTIKEHVIEKSRVDQNNRKENLEQTMKTVLKEKFSSFERISDLCSRRQIDDNVFLLNDISSGLIPEQSVPTAPSELSILIEIYKRSRRVSDLQRHSRQSAKPIELLRKRGFILLKENPKSGSYVFRDSSGEMCRQITHFQQTETFDEGMIRLSSSERKQFLMGKVDFLNNRKIDLEIDHRQPREAIRKTGQLYPALDSSLLSSGTADQYYQCLTRETNLTKKSACTKCMSGDEIVRLPLIQELESLGYCYKKDFYDQSLQNQKKGLPNCYGCFWFDYKRPLKKG